MGLVNNALKHLAEKTLPVEYVNPEFASWRMEICRACPRFDPDKEKCRECGCYLEIKTTCYTNRNPKKFRTEYTHCPLGKWNDKALANQYRAADGLPLLK